MHIDLSDTASESFILTKKSSLHTFHFTSIDFYLFIIKVSLVVELENSNWQQIIPKLQMKLNVYYQITGATSIERAEEILFPIYLLLTLIMFSFIIINWI